MKLYFIGGSLQKKFLIESDFAEDLYDVMMGFFEEHGWLPHFLSFSETEDGVTVTFGSTSEHFLIVGADETAAEEIGSLWRSYTEDI